MAYLNLRKIFEKCAAEAVRSARLKEHSRELASTSEELRKVYNELKRSFDEVKHRQPGNRRHRAERV